MKKEIDEDLKEVIQAEKSQAKLTYYNINIGKWFLFILPIILVIITLLTLFVFQEDLSKTFLQQDIGFQILTIIYVISLAIYFINSVVLLLAAHKTNKSLKLRLDFERKRGRPIDSLDGFELLRDNVWRVLEVMNLTGIVAISSVILFSIMLVFGDANLGWIAMATTLVGFGLAFIIRSLNLNLTKINGLQDFFKPLMHQIFLDNYFAEVFSNHLDPVSYLHWDEYIIGIKELLNPNFVKKINGREKGENPVTFAIEKLLFLYYLKYQGVLSGDKLTQEFKEVVDINSEDFDIKKGYQIEGKWTFSQQDIYNLFEFIREYNPGFFTLIDRLQLELVDNIERISKDPIYLDTAAQEVCYLNDELNIMVFLYNNSEDAKDYQIRIAAPGFEPKKVSLNINVEGRGSFTIPENDIPLTSNDGEDVTSVMSSLLENADTAWITLEPRQKGEQTLQIFLEDANGRIIEGETRTIKIKRNLKDYLKKLSSLGSIVSGIAVAVSRVIL
ncbi:MAG: membrane protein of unknown function [Promethearchaeota archaeon]|nr:MAG: membrane protein of unknown function [Candidatus Lokiarchaeota archaeon]